MDVGEGLHSWLYASLCAEAGEEEEEGGEVRAYLPTGD